MHIRPYERLIAWQEAHQLCLWIYNLTRKFPPDERFRIVNQMCKSGYSVPMNIAEGNAKRTKRDKAHFLNIAIGSLEELHYQCLLAKDLHYISTEEFTKSDDHIQRTSYLLIKLHASLPS